MSETNTSQPPGPAPVIDAATFARLPPALQGVALLVALGSGVSALGLRLGDPEPPATAAEVATLRTEVADLKDAVRELGFQIRLYHAPRE